MGTSGAGRGPRDGGNLLPPDAPPPPETGDDEDETTVDPGKGDENGGDEATDQDVETGGTWSGARRSITDYSRYAAQGRTEAARRNLRRGLGGYVQAQGGARSSAQASPSGRQAARTLGSFLSTAAREGVAEAVRQFDVVNYRGSDATTLLAALTDRLVSRTGLDEDDLARKAMCETLLELVDEGADDPLHRLQDLDADQIRDVLERYVGQYVSGRILQVLGDRWEANEVSEAAVVKQGDAIEEYVLFSAESLFQRIDPLSVDWDGDEGAKVVRDLFEEAHSLLEAPA